MFGVVGSGMLFALSDEKGFLAHRDTGALLHIYVALKTPADWASAGPIDFTDTAEAKAALLASFDGWDETLRELIARADGPLVARPIHALPIGHRWERTPGVTLLGDAAHLMSPFAGEGANLAMIDGTDLAAAILAHARDTEAALAAYEKQMFTRAEPLAAESAANLEICFRADAPQGLVDLFAGYRR